VPVSRIEILLAALVSPPDLMLFLPVSPFDILLVASFFPFDLLLVVLIDELFDFLLVKAGLLEWLSAFAMRQGHTGYLLYILLGCDMSTLQSS
jgi:hypothetical protein